MELNYHVIIKNQDFSYKYEVRKFEVDDKIKGADLRWKLSYLFKNTRGPNDYSSNENQVGWYSNNYPVHEFSIFWETNFGYGNSGIGDNYVIVKKGKVVIERYFHINDTPAFVDILNKYVAISEVERTKLYIKGLENAFSDFQNQISNNQKLIKLVLDEITKIKESDEMKASPFVKNFNLIEKLLKDIK